MASDNEPAKLILPYLQRADELQKHEPLVAYYCRLYAMERGLKIPQSDRTKTTSALLVSLLNQLEKDKKSLKLSPDDNLHVEGFALNVFAKADKQDRAGRADLNTAKTFYAASIFFEILNQFGELQPDIEQKQKYAVWKAADIRKAVKEGRKPIPGPPIGDKDQSVLSNASSGEYDLDSSRSDNEPRVGNLTSTSRVEPPSRTASGSDLSPQMHNHDENMFQNSPNISPPHYPTETYNPQSQNQLFQSYPSHDMASQTYPNFQSYPSFSDSRLPSAPSHYPSYHQGSDASYTSLSPSNMTNYASTAQHDSSGINANGTRTENSSHNSKKYEYDSNYQPPPGKLAEAQKAARFAVGALAFDDVFVAVDHLKKALELLTNPSAGD